MQLKNSWPLPSFPKPIVIIGAGGIVNDAHMPAYRKANFDVLGLYDIDRKKVLHTAKKWGLKSYTSLDGLISDAEKNQAVFDLATPPSAIQGILKKIPVGSTVLIQKPMGEDFKDAKSIRSICRRRKLTAAVNFQLRFSPMMMIVQDCIGQNVIGDITDFEVHLNLLTPWELFPFLKKMSRVEIAVHSIHYLDLIRSFLGNPSGVWAQTLGHPSSKEFAQTRTTAILNYGPDIRCSLSINHNYRKGPNFQAAQIRIDGIEGAALIKLGLLLDYPKGEPDEVWIYPNAGSEWEKIDFEGGWFPDAFIGTMSNLQRFTSGEDKILYTSVEDAFHTMSLVESCYISSKKGGTALPQ